MVSRAGRVLPAPALVYGGDPRNNTIVPREGVWNMRNQTFVDPRQMLRFGVLNISRVRDDEIKRFVIALTESGRRMGMKLSIFVHSVQISNSCLMLLGMGMGQPLFVRHCQSRDLENTMKMAKKNHPDLQILFVLINRKGDPAYGKRIACAFYCCRTPADPFVVLAEVIKRVGDLDLRLTTQCVQERNVKGKPGFGPDESTMANICLKLNAKLGGVNNLIARDSR